MVMQSLYLIHHTKIMQSVQKENLRAAPLLTAEGRSLEHANIYI